MPLARKSMVNATEVITVPGWPFQWLPDKSTYCLKPKKRQIAFKNNSLKFTIFYSVSLEI